MIGFGGFFRLFLEVSRFLSFYKGKKKMGNNLHQLLRSLCFNTHWNYAIFWKLKHCAPNPMYVITTTFAHLSMLLMHLAQRIVMYYLKFLGRGAFFVGAGS